MYYVTYSQAESYSLLCRDGVPPLTGRVLITNKQHIRLGRGPLERHRWHLGGSWAGLGGRSVATSDGTFPTPAGSVLRTRRERSIGEAVHTSRVWAVGPRGWRSGRRGTSWLIKGRPPTRGEARITDSAIWRLRVLLTVWTEAKGWVGEEIIGSMMCTGRDRWGNDDVMIQACNILKMGQKCTYKVLAGLLV